LAAQPNRIVRDDIHRAMSFVSENLVKALKQPGLTPNQVLTQVGLDVRAATSGTQDPQKYGDTPDFFLTGAPPAPETPPKTTQLNLKDGQIYVRIGKGTFKMGCVPSDNACSSAENPQHTVTLTHGFWIAQTAVTVGAWGDYLTKTRGNVKNGM